MNCIYFRVMGLSNLQPNTPKWYLGGGVIDLAVQTPKPSFLQIMCATIEKIYLGDKFKGGESVSPIEKAPIILTTEWAPFQAN